MGQVTPAAFEFRSVTKSFSGCVANRDVSFQVAHNSIHGVVGENGAGKSTIMKVLYGLYQPDSGEVWVKGAKTVVANPHVAISLGIGMVHQHFMLVPTLSVLQNIILGQEPGLFRPYRPQTRDEINQMQREFGFNLDLDAEIEGLPVGQQQQVEILKLLYHRADILILDEPTAVLTPQEVEALFERLRALGRSGKTIVLISHKLKEILSLTTRVTVMRQGRVVENVETKNLDEARLAELIIGRKVVALPGRKTLAQAEDRVVVKNLTTYSADGKDGHNLKDVSFTIRAGEIVGVAGVSGNGQEALIEALASVNRRYRGSATLDGVELKTLKTYEARQNGVAVVPPDRHHEGAILDFSVYENFLLGHHRSPEYTRGGWIQQGRLETFVDPLLEKYDVRPRDGHARLGGLSGGNQQKAVIAREMARPTRFLIAAYPTRGVDIGAIEFIHSLFLRERDRGAAILLVSSELEEILALADRIVVLFDGRIVGEVERARASESQLGCWMTGLGVNDGK